MNILQYNIQSLKKNKNSLDFHLRKLNIDICFLSEIFNIDEKQNSTTFQNYNIVSKKRKDNYGGVAIILKKNIQFKRISFQSTLDILICQTTNLNNNLTLVAVYFPHSVKSITIKNELEKITSFLNSNPNTFICGDFNARHSAFGDFFDSQRGKMLKEFFDYSNFRCLNDGSYTFKKRINDNTGSVLDLSFTNSTLSLSWKVQKTIIGGSHHLPIILKLSDTICNGKKFLAKKKLIRNLAILKLNPDFEEINFAMQAEIKKATYVIDNKRNPKPWWDPFVEKQFRLQVAAQKKYDLHSNDTNALNLFQAIKNFKNATKYAKRQSFKSKITTLNMEPNSKSLFRLVKGCKNSLSCNNGGKWSENNNKIFLIHLRDQVLNNSHITFPPNTQRTPVELTMEEFSSVLNRKKKPSAAGLDGITYEMINNLSESSKYNLFQAMNTAWKKCELRENWRKIKIVPIPKKGKDLEIFTNFRPISLISVFLKIINLMIKERLQSFLQEQDILPTNTYAYRKNFSSSMCINHLLYTINYHKEKGEKVILLSIDIEKAYDCVNLLILYKILSEINCPEDIKDWTINFLKKRTIVMGNEMIDIYNGLPQGSCLSPILFNIYTLGLHGIADQNTYLFQFADDFILLSTDKEFEMANENLQHKANHFYHILSRLNLKYNPDKTFVMYVAKGPRKIPNIKLQNTNINSVEKIKFLGRYIKNSLSLKEHYDEVMNSCTNSLNALKMINNAKNGLLPNISINLTKSLVFSKTEYAISSMAHMPQYLNKKLTSFQNQMLRRSLGLTPSTPIHNIYALAVMLPPEQRSQYLAAKELIKFKMYNNTLYNCITTDSSVKTSLGFIYNKFKHILDRTMVNQKRIPSKKISFLDDLFKAVKYSKSNEFFRAILQEKLVCLKNQGHSIWSTDASVTDSSTGCAVCNISMKHNYAFRITSKTSSLMGELHAINKAIDIMIEENTLKAVILTDSKNACLTLKTNTHHNYLANDIIHKINNSNLQSLIFIWTPSHIGIPANELADYFAKHAATAGCIITTNASITDAYSAIYDHLWKEWVDKYKDASETKGTYFSQFFNTPPKSYWFTGSKMSPGNIKLINRLLTGHTYGKIYLHRIKVEASDICTLCGITESEDHQIFHCPKFCNERKQFKIFERYKDLPSILKTFSPENFVELSNFIHKCNLQL